LIVDVAGVMTGATFSVGREETTGAVLSIEAEVTKEVEP
jgi:hypothetical protein